MKSKTVRFQDDMGTNGSKVLVVFYVYYYYFCFEDGGGPLIRRRSTKSFKGEFQIGDIVDYVHDGLEVSVHVCVCVCVCVIHVILYKTTFGEGVISLAICDFGEKFQ